MGTDTSVTNEYGADQIQILEGLERERENPYVLDIINEIIANMSDLWKEIVDIE